jgi:hypothetical protein
MKFKNFLLGFSVIPLLLTGCATYNPKNTGQYALNSCPECVSKLVAVQYTRLLNLKVTTDDPNLEIAYQALNGDYQKFGNIYLTKGSFDGVVRIPENTTILVTGKNDSDFHTVTGIEVIKPSETSATVNLKVVPLVDKLKDEYKTLSKTEKKELIEVVSYFDVAMNSPRMLFSSKVSEAEREFNTFLVDMPDSFKSTSLYSELNFLKMTMQLIDASPSSGSSIGVNRALNKISLLKSAML